MKQASPGAGGQHRGVNSDSDYQWIDLADFTAGCYSYSSVAGTDPNVPAPHGALNADETYSCVALPNGGLGPLPGVAQSYDWTDTSGGATVTTFVTGLLVHDEIGQVEAIVMVEWDDGTNHYFIADSFLPASSAFTRITSTTNASGGKNEFPFGSPYPQMTRATDTDPTSTPGAPVCFFPVASFAYPNATAGQIFCYPNPASRTSYTPLKLITDGSPQSESGMILAHENRLVVLANAGYDWPAGGAGVWGVNETINFTDPPNSVTYPASSTTGQQLIAVAEEPYGYGCGGSISAGELVLIKRLGGAAVITGDLFDPTSITPLPGVQGTGQGYGNADSGQGGLVYCSIDEGAWIWNGSNTSEKISGNLDDAFYTNGQQFIYLSWYTKWIGDKIYFSNNWMLDTRTNSWWRYWPTAGQGGHDLFWIQPVDGDTYWCAPLTFQSTDKTFLLEFSESTPAKTWQAQTLPIRLTTERYVELRRVVVRASSNGGNTGATIKVEVLNGSTVVGSVTTPATIGPTPTMIRMPIGSVTASGADQVYASEDITVRITADGNGGAAPNLHSCSIGYTQRAQAPTVGVSS